VENFISKATGAYVWSQDHPMGRWNESICPLVAGLPQTDGQLLFDRLVDALKSVGRDLGTSGCRPNFFVIVSAHPDADLKSLWSRAVGMFGDARGAQKYVDTPRPVRIWYNATFVDGDGGRGMNPLCPKIAPDIPCYRIAELPHQEFSAVPEITSVIAVVDYSRVIGLDWRQVADYIAMAGLTEINLATDVGEVPSILRLFTTTGDARPQRLTDWDKAFIKELYLTEAVYRHQRVDIAKRMYADLTAP
jgi:hypothetical protein